ncbi:hypothetical protein [Roseimaritima sediminicola]|uniref:hypothetical protein n=1 Tax=Roseimaritima sediminicola TaxID=2662066 RepID=UPI0012983570|nr:hypothetical protein [Roseimaritima sediminicola]
MTFARNAFFRNVLLFVLTILISCTFPSPTLCQDEIGSASPIVTDGTFPSRDIVVLGLSSILIRDGARLRTEGGLNDSKKFADVDSVELEGHINRDLIAFVASFENLRALTVHDQPPQLDLNNTLSPLGQAKNLKILRLPVVETSIRRCAVLGELQGLERLQLGFLLTREDFSAISKLPDLRVLDIFGIQRSSYAIGDRIHFDSLDELSVSAYSDLMHFKQTDRIRKLHIRQHFEDQYLNDLLRFKNLLELSITGSCVEVVAQLERLPELQSLTIAVSRRIR